MKNNTTQKGASAPSAAEIAAVVAAFKSATREEQLVLNGVMIQMAMESLVSPTITAVTTLLSALEFNIHPY